jgi:hypothetical protein
MLAILRFLRVLALVTVPALLPSSWSKCLFFKNIFAEKLENFDSKHCYLLQKWVKALPEN